MFDDVKNFIVFSRSQFVSSLNYKLTILLSKHNSPQYVIALINKMNRMKIKIKSIYKK